MTARYGVCVCPYRTVLYVTLVLELCVMNNRPGSRAGEQRGELPVFMTAVALMLLKTLSRLFTLMRAVVCAAHSQQCVSVCVEKMGLHIVCICGCVRMSNQIMCVCVFAVFMALWGCVKCLAVVLNVGFN